MSAAREAVLARVRAALADVQAAAVPEVARGYRLRGERDESSVVALFLERVREYGAVALESATPAVAVAERLAAVGASRVVVADDLEPGLRPAGVELVPDTGLGLEALDRLDAAVTTCAAACAETGTLALDGGPGQGRRAITLVPDVHVCVVRRDQIVETVPELLARLEAGARAGRPIVLVSGPSATSDIGFERVEGVHGPRRLVVVVAPREF